MHFYYFLIFCKLLYILENKNGKIFEYKNYDDMYDKALEMINDNSILKYINEDDGLSLSDKFNNWVDWKEKNRINFGGNSEHIKSTYGEKTFFKYDWGKVQTWSEIFEYLYLSQKGSQNGL